ncbi:hypothetical protein IE4803_PD00163 (plasmid) [Rhizobium etli bv. phaseoli str. IE4803]|uniref:Uncharacterized protein n=2 Tax=Rhizobium/Agrobacterium group TaxID=227290 RepID=A0A060ICT9_RHIET|nr:hypothetical protein IE4771_PE00229 [Rhizobium sp. IE4771]AJC83363.1 hypothetical protein IE4803_PD00163 [Rhizobium etli bv. phaseoli str. IE4803]ARQ62183.1 hypothetical protein Kim5_PD00176 [Rhizobium sp. Kim5]
MAISPLKPARLHVRSRAFPAPMAKGYISLLSRPSRLETMRIITGWLGFDGCEEFRQRSKVLPRRPQYISAGNRKIDDGLKRTNDTAGSPADFTRRHI